MRILSLLFFLCCGSVLVAEEGKLERAKKEVRKEKPRPTSQSTNSNNSNNTFNSSLNDDDDDYGFFSFLADIFKLSFRWSSKQPTSLVGNTFYPYFDSYPGYYAPYDFQHVHSVIGGSFYTEASVIENNLQRYALGGHVSFSAFTIRTDWQRYFEERSNDTHDTLNLGTIDAELAIITLPKARLNIGVGAIILHDNIGTVSGAAVMVNAIAFPIAPLVIESAYSFGDVQGTDITIARANIGALWHRYEGYAGWHYTRIGSVTLDGPLLGIRLWY